MGGARGWGESYTYTSTVVCIHCAGGWSLLLTASRTVPPSLSSWGAEHNEKPPTTSTPGSDTSNHCPALKETVGLETFNSNPFTVGESCFTPTTVACDVTYRKQTTHSSIGRARSKPAAAHTFRDTGRGGGCPPRICARPTSSSGGCCLATQSPYGRQQLVVDDPSADVNRSRDLLSLSKCPYVSDSRSRRHCTGRQARVSRTSGGVAQGIGTAFHPAGRDERFHRGGRRGARVWRGSSCSGEA